MQIGFLYAGQGSQAPGMGKDFYENYESVKEFYDSIELDFDLKEYCWLINKLGKELAEPFIKQYINLNNDLNSYDLYLMSFYPEFNYENTKIYEINVNNYLSFPWWYNYFNSFI